MHGETGGSAARADPTGRPRVVINFASSLDGKISTASRSRVRFTSERDVRLMHELRAAADAVLIGAGTLRAEDPPLELRDPALLRRRREEGRDETPAAIVLSSSLDLPVGARFFRGPRSGRVVATTEDAPPSRVARIEPLADVLRCGRGRVAIPPLLEKLARRGIRSLLVEGGGEVNAAFLEAGCVDEVRLTLAPVVIGGRGAPTGADGVGFAQGSFPEFDLAECKVEGNEVFLRYLRREG